MRGVVVWLTGLPCSGKSTLAAALSSALATSGKRVEVLDGDVVRRELSQELGFSRRDRDINVQRIGYVAGLLAKHGVIVIAAVVSPYADARRRVRELCGEFVEVYVRCPLEECERRDVKGMYRKARAGALPAFTGVSDPYEPPTAPEVIIDTQRSTLEDSLRELVANLVLRGYVDEAGRGEVRGHATQVELA